MYLVRTVAIGNWDYLLTWTQQSSQLFHGVIIRECESLQESKVLCVEVLIWEVSLQNMYKNTHTSHADSWILEFTG